MDMLTFANFQQLRKVVFGEIEKLREKKLVGISLDCGVIIPEWLAKEFKDNLGWELSDYPDPNDPVDTVADMLTVSVVYTHSRERGISVFSIPQIIREQNET